MELIEIAKSLIKARNEDNIELWYKKCRQLDDLKLSLKDKFAKSIYEYRRAFFDVSTDKDKKQFQKLQTNLEKMIREAEKKLPKIIKKKVRIDKGKKVKDKKSCK